MAAYDITENLISCSNCIYQYYDPESDLYRCSRHGGRICGDDDEKDVCLNRVPRIVPEPWTGFRMIEGLMDETLADDEEIMIYIVLGAAQAVKMAVIDMDDCTRQRAEVIRDVAKRIFTERKNENE